MGGGGNLGESWISSEKWFPIPDGNLGEVFKGNLGEAFKGNLGWMLMILVNIIFTSSPCSSCNTFDGGPRVTKSKSRNS